MSEQVLDEENWKVEAQSVINDIIQHVKSAEVSENLRNSDQKIYINLTTLEEETYCVELSRNGFRIAGKLYDIVNIEDGQYFETPYSLLSSVSPDFYKSFGDALISKLEALNQN